MNRILINALAFYGLKSANAELIRHYDNLVYKVEAEKVYALRICPSIVNQKRLNAEIDWLTALRQDTNLLVPKPLPNKQGNLISQLENRFCVLFEWLKGKPISSIVSPKVARQVGETMALLHLHASNYCLDDRMRNFIDCYDRDYFFGSNSWWQTKAKERLPNDYKGMIPGIEKARHLIESLDKSPEQFGMVHSDLHFGNIICDGEKYAVIDFGDCGMGYYLMDIAVTEAEFKDYCNADLLISAFREGYRDRRGYFPRSEDVRTFEVMSSLLLLEWIFESESDRVREDKAKWITQIVKTIQEIV